MAISLDTYCDTDHDRPRRSNTMIRTYHSEHDFASLSAQFEVLTHRLTASHDSAVRVQILSQLRDVIGKIDRFQTELNSSGEFGNDREQIDSVP
jgi:hypothetical protein